MYCLYVGFVYTYIDINALDSQIWFQAVAGARSYVCMDVCRYEVRPVKWMMGSW